MIWYHKTSDENASMPTKLSPDDRSSDMRTIINPRLAQTHIPFCHLDGSHGGSGSRVRHSVVVSAGNAVVVLLVKTRSRNAWNFIVVANVQPESGRVDVAVTPQEEDPEDGLGHDVEDTVEDSFRVR